MFYHAKCKVCESLSSIHIFLLIQFTYFHSIIYIYLFFSRFSPIGLQWVWRIAWRRLSPPASTSWSRCSSMIPQRGSPPRRRSSTPTLTTLIRPPCPPSPANIRSKSSFRLQICLVKVKRRTTQLLTYLTSTKSSLKWVQNFLIYTLIHIMYFQRKNTFFYFIGTFSSQVLLLINIYLLHFD